MKVDVKKGFHKSEFWLVTAGTIGVFGYELFTAINELPTNTTMNLGILATVATYALGRSWVYAAAYGATLFRSFTRNDNDTTTVNVTAPPAAEYSVQEVQAAPPAGERVFSDSQTVEPIPSSFAPVEAVVN